VRRLLAALSTLAGVLAVLVPAQPAQAASYWGGSFNMDHGNTAYANVRWTTRADAVISSIRSRQPAFLAVQETCYQWVTRIRDATGYGAYIGGVARSRGGADIQCYNSGGGGTFGNAVFFQKSFLPNAYPREHNLRTHDVSGSIEQREMLCVVSDTVRRVVCSAHLSRNNARARAHEASVIKEDLRYWYSNYTVFLGVDANDLPTSSTLNQLYHSSYGGGAGGSWKEATSPCDDRMASGCRSGPRTHSDGKIDYVFVTPSVRINGWSVNNATYSGHDLVWALVAF
jgi:endonuclease/exonuclease/phosphatase family metal-dependent hydrolase